MEPRFTGFKSEVGSMKALFKSIGCALKGLREAIRERNFLIEIGCAVLVIISIIVLKTSYIENAILVICIGVVLGGEVMNTALEKLSDFVSPSHHAEIGAIKDLMAAGVLIFSLLSRVVGFIILGSHLLPLL